MTLDDAVCIGLYVGVLVLMMRLLWTKLRK